MALTDFSADPGVQPRLWLTTLDGELRSKRQDVRVGGWSNWGGTADSGVAGVSLSGATQRERVFYRSGTALLMRGYDATTTIVSATLPAPSGGTVTGYDVGAVTWNDAGTDRIAVAARSSLGTICMWEGTFTGGFPTAPTCIADSTSPTDIAAASNGTPAFFYGSSSDIVRIRRTGVNAWSRTLLIGPTGGLASGRSLDVVPSTIVAGSFEIAVNATPARLGRVSLTGTTITWTSAPALPSGLAVTTERDSLSLVRYRPTGAANDRLALGVTAYRGGRSTLLRLNTNTAGTAWNAVWTTSVYAPVEAYPRDELSFFGAAAGAAVASGTGTEPAFFGAAGAFAFFAYGATAQVYSDAFGWRDYVRPQFVRPRVLGYGELDPGSATDVFASVGETVTVAETISGTATGIRRNSGTPWEVTLSSSTEAGGTWNDEFVVAQLPSLVAGLGVPESLTDRISHASQATAARSTIYRSRFRSTPRAPNRRSTNVGWSIAPESPPRSPT